MLMIQGGVIGGVNAAIGLINKIPGVNISKIPQLYHGTDDWQGGFAYINEGGRGELVNLPNGAQVIPHDVSMRYAREAGRQASHESGGSVVSLGRVETLLGQILDYQDKIANKETDLVLDTGEFVGSTYSQYDRHGGDHTRLTGRWD